MTKQNLIRILSGLMFLIFFCPFFQMCSDEGLKRFPFKRLPIVETVTDSTFSAEHDSIKNSGDYITTNKEDATTYLETAFQEDRKEFTKSGYGLVAVSFEVLYEVFYDGFSAEDFSDLGLYLFVTFSLIPVLLLVLFVLALKRKFKAVGITGGIIILLNIICLTILSVDEVLEDISQIKYGYYLFVINLIVIITLCAKMKIKTLRDGIDW